MSFMSAIVTCNVTGNVFAKPSFFHYTEIVFARFYVTILFSPCLVAILEFNVEIWSGPNIVLCKNGLN